ncbi:MAG: lactate racemase domain-containing protein [Phycisphaerae bacterium]
MIQAANDACIHTVTDSDPSFLFHCGEGFFRHALPPGTDVIYPQEPFPPIPDRMAAIHHALDHPQGDDPLDAQLKAGMKVTIAFDDISLPLPRMRRPDIRQSIIEIVLERLDRAGITDIELICAICLHRRCTPKELKYFVGPKVFRRFWPERLYNHDAEDPEGNVLLGTTESGEEVELNRRAVESDLLIYVNINLVTMDGGHKSVPVGLSTYRSVRHHHNAKMLLEDSSYMDTRRSHFHRSCERMGQVVKKAIKIFTIETTLNGSVFPTQLNFMQKREHHWSLADHLGYQAGRIGLGLLPGPLRRKAYSALPGGHQLLGVNAGETEAVHAKTLESVHAQQCVAVPGQYDVVILAMPSLGPYNVNSILNPILVNCLGLGYFFNFYRNRPLVRRGGAIVLIHPIENKFHMVHHPSYYDFFEEVLTATRDPHEMEQKYEKDYAENQRYINLYRNSYAYHGVHPFYMWYWGAHGQAHVGKVFAVNPVSQSAARRLGYECTRSLDEALNQARDFAGGEARVCYFHCPPAIMCDVS